MKPSKQRHYRCAECGGEVEQRKETGGLGTWNCRKHPERTTTVMRDHSGGKEADRMHRSVPVAVRRHTKVEGV